MNDFDPAIEGEGAEVEPNPELIVPGFTEDETAEEEDGHLGVPEVEEENA